MPQIGYTLASEEHGPRDLVRYAKLAEDAGFPFALVSDHYHPWTDTQGQSPFVWGTLGGIAEATERIEIGTGVTCPTMRIHPAVIAQAAATAAVMLPGRFFLGVGSGENLNEHILGEGWPEVAVRQEMLEEAIEVIRLLWEGGLKSHRGRHYTVENARLYTLPDEPPPVAVAASGPKAAELAGRVGDAFVGVAPNGEVVEKFESSGGSGKPKYGQVTVCWAEDEAEARRTAYEWWPNIAAPGDLSQELRLPSQFEAVAESASEDEIAELIACGPDPERHVEFLDRFADAGYDHLFIHQVGPDQEGAIRFYEREILSRYH